MFTKMIRIRQRTFEAIKEIAETEQLSLAELCDRVLTQFSSEYFQDEMIDDEPEDDEIVSEQEELDGEDGIGQDEVDNPLDQDVDDDDE